MVGGTFNYTAVTYLVNSPSEFQFWVRPNKKRLSSWLRLDLLKGCFHLALISLSTWWYFKWQTDQDDSWSLSLPWIVKAEQRLLRFWSKSRLSLRWLEISLSLLLYHGRYRTISLELINMVFVPTTIKPILPRRTFLQLDVVYSRLSLSRF